MIRTRKSSVSWSVRLVGWSCHFPESPDRNVVRGSSKRIWPRLPIEFLRFGATQLLTAASLGAALCHPHLFVQFDEWGLERSSHSRPRGGTILFTFARHSVGGAAAARSVRSSTLARSPKRVPIIFGSVLSSAPRFLPSLFANEMFGSSVRWSAGLASCLFFFYESCLNRASLTHGASPPSLPSRSQRAF